MSKNDELLEMTRYFEYLDDLRESGETNMFGAAPYLADEFGLTKEAARPILRKWQNTFDGESPPRQRATRAMMAT